MSSVATSTATTNCVFQFQNVLRDRVDLSLKSIGLFLSKPAHLFSEPLIRSLVTPIRPGENGNLSSPLLEKIRRIFWVLFCTASAPITVGLALLGGVLEKTGDIVTQKPYTSFKGSLSPKEEDGQIKMLTLNACMLWGGLPIPLGGMRPPRHRVSELTQKILGCNPDILTMQEVAFDSGVQLYQALRKNYAHFYTRIGPNSPLMESGLFVASKFPVLNAGFLPFPKQFGINRGVFWIETPKCFYITTHMEFGATKAAEERRKAQLQIIQKKVGEWRQRKPCFVLGDFNLDRSDKEDYQHSGIPSAFHDPYDKKYPHLSEASSTCTDAIGAYILGRSPPKKPWEMIDYALLAKGPHDRFHLAVEQLKTYDDRRPYAALSDHRGLVLTAIA